MGRKMVMTADVRDNKERSRYEIYVDGEMVGIADYFVTGDSVVFPHTVINPERRGQGLAAQLVQAALDDVRDAGRSVVPQCWYVGQFIDEHPEYRDLLAA
jgi:predicted GNAT family acetyltransferase